VHDDLERDFILDAESTLDYGLVDEIVQRRRVASVAVLPGISARPET
jgi:ATP-dependent protease ClpP protease subunit